MNSPSVGICIPKDYFPLPAKWEVAAAMILAKHFKTIVNFVPRSSHKTPDFIIKGQTWELKSPTGDGKRTIQHQFSRGLKQSKNLIIDARRSKIHMARFRNLVEYEFAKCKTLHHLILIDKQGKITEYSK